MARPLIKQYPRKSTSSRIGRVSLLTSVPNFIDLSH
nr:MAG TPA: hypothetical protein [Caudoviricetes sp.]DAX38998.1 MAG TPA: hypothetical protein [Caudoviricetes sp.]